LAGDEDLPVAVELAPLDDDDTPERPEPAPAGELIVAGAATVPAAPSDAPASERKPR
jgi:hypothetical protein